MILKTKQMNEENKVGLDEKTKLFNKALGLGMIILGIYGLIYAYELIKKK